MVRLVDASQRFDLRRVDAAFTSLAEWLVHSGQRLRTVQTGRVYNYLLAIVAWGIGAMILAAAVAAVGAS
jgi:hypothetical protein